LWLACRERWQSMGMWTRAIVVAISFIALVASDLHSEIWIIWRSVGLLFTAALYLWAASQAGRFFLEARRSGLVELLLAAPVSVDQMVRGQWRALLRMFALPVVLMLAVNLLAVALSERSWGGITGPVAMGKAFPQLLLSLFTALAAAGTTAANLIALGWFGMWMGLTSKNNNVVTLKTLLFVQVIPWFVITFASAMVIPLLLLPALFKSGLGASGRTSAVTSQMTNWFPLVSVALTALLSIAKDVGFILLARRQLYSSFRERAARGINPIPFAAPAPLARPLAAPPVIPLQPSA